SARAGGVQKNGHADSLRHSCVHLLFPVAWGTERLEVDLSLNNIANLLLHRGDLLGRIDFDKTVTLGDFLVFLLDLALEDPEAFIRIERPTHVESGLVIL